MTETRSTQTRGGSAAATTTLALVLGVAGSSWLAWTTVSTSTPVPARGLLISAGLIAAVALPAVLVAVHVTRAALRRAWGRAPGVLVESFAVAPAAALAIALGHQLGQVLLRDDTTSSLLPVLAMVADTVTLLVVLLPLACLLVALLRSQPGRIPMRLRAALVAAVWLLVAAVPAGMAPSAAAPAAESLACLAGGPVDRAYDVTALDVDITVNRYGNHDPVGKMYALTSRLPDIAAAVASRTVSVGLPTTRSSRWSSAPTRASASRSRTRTPPRAATSACTSTASSSRPPRPATPWARTRRPPCPRARPGPTASPSRWTRRSRAATTCTRGRATGQRWGTDCSARSWSSRRDRRTGTRPSRTSRCCPAGRRSSSRWTPASPCIPRSYQPTCAFREAALLHHEIGNDNESILDKANRPVPLVDDTTGSYRPGVVRAQLPVRAVPQPPARLPEREVARLQLVHVR